MKVLLIGSGGREHALAWKLAQSEQVTELVCAPGNAGIAEVADIVPVAADDIIGILALIQRDEFDFVVVGPEQPLALGIVDAIQDLGVKVFGPTEAAAQLESSKAFTKDLCSRYNIPTAAYGVFTDLKEAKAYLKTMKPPYVLKADGLAAGKGVVLPETLKKAEKELEDFFSGKFGEASAKVVIEEFMSGQEASFFALTDGENIIRFGSAQDHKRVGEGDVGPNTGGMGAYSPAPVLTADLEDRVMRDIIEPTVKAMADDGMAYNGVLFAGLMLTEDGPKLIEYNCRFGDPECQVLMMRYQGDFAALLKHIADGTLVADEVVEFSNQSALTVVMAAKGYPASPEKGGVIDLGAQDDVQIFHAGTAIKDGMLVANGGRVLNVTAMGDSVTAAQKSVYAAIDKIDFPSGFYRCDIGYREIARETQAE